MKTLSGLLRLSLASIMLTGLLAQPVFAEHFSNNQAGIQFDVPDAWNTEAEDQVIMITPKADDFFILFMVLETESMEEAIDAMADEMDKIIANAEMNGEEPKSLTINGLKGHYVEGTGEIEDVEVTWEMTLLYGKKPVLVLSVAQVGALKKYEKEMTKFIKSIKKL